MLRTKICLLIILLSLQINFAQSFTYSGPTNVTVGFGNNTAGGTYSFSYQNLNNACYPSLVISVNNEVLSGDLCNNRSTPNAYTINFTPGTHTVRFKLLSINCNTLNCYHMIIHQEVSFTVSCYFQISVENNFGGGSIYANGNKVSPARINSSVSNVSIGAIEQSYDNYYRVWNTSQTNKSAWDRDASYGYGWLDNSQSTSYSILSNDLNTKLIANLRKQCNLTFQNSYGSMYVAGSTYSSSVTVGVVEQNSITAYGNTYVNNGIE
ncbi:MAG: hypothetical protein FD143_1856 [Ignavibacteria bacterium]|nr:MAG: hypothetical protein FD143_1856 [Ignavibacteria bacterium]KAF0157698.1 MAG: hypothetical protein FD188_2677 [Ignavibacteria bacterium]